MGFRQGALARLWSYDDEGRYGTGNMSISDKNKESGEYKITFQDGFVRFVGSAHEKAMSLNLPTFEEFRAGSYNRGASFRIMSCDATKTYDKEKKKTYTNFTIFDIELPDENGRFASFAQRHTDNAPPEAATAPAKAKTSKTSKKAAAPSEDEDENLGDSDLPF